MPRLALAAFLLGLLAGGCTPRATPACLERCAELQVRDPKQCQTLCTTSCRELRDTYGVAVEQCRELQAAAPPAQ